MFSLIFIAITLVTFIALARVLAHGEALATARLVQVDMVTPVNVYGGRERLAAAMETVSRKHLKAWRMRDAMAKSWSATEILWFSKG